MLDVFGLDEWSPAVTALLAGTGLGFIYGLIPGIGGRIGLIVSLPIAALFDPYPAAIFLVALHSINNTSSSIPTIALGMPTGTSDTATLLDGYPLTKKGRGGEALGASLSASALGGVLGALSFVAAIPIARPLVTSFGPPEMLMLALFGITLVASLSREGLLQGLVVGALGIIFATVGLDGRTGEQRFTFGVLDLWDGLSIPALVCGLFVIPELLTVKRHVDHEAQYRAMTTKMADVWRGMFITLRHKAVLFRSSLYGILVGMAPAVGSSVAVWMAYGHAARTTRSDIPFGQGAIAGVIAPEAANNSKEGGAMIPTLFFAIPGSSGMAVMMAAFGYVGVPVGPNFLTTDIGLSYALAATVLLANLLAIIPFFLVVPLIVRMAAVRREAIAPIAIAISITAALIDSPTLSTIVQLLVGATLGIGLTAANWPRAPFLLGFVIADMGESSFFLTSSIWGWSALTRPLTALLAIGLVGWLIFSIGRRPPLVIAGPRALTLVVTGALIFFFGVTFVFGLALPIQSATVPLAVSGFGLMLCLLIGGAAVKARNAPTLDEKMQNVGLAAAFVGATPILGLSVTTLGFVAGMLRRSGISLRNSILTAVIVCLFQFALLDSVFDVLVERELLGRILWRALGY